MDFEYAHCDECEELTPLEHVLYYRACDHMYCTHCIKFNAKCFYCNHNDIPRMFTDDEPYLAPRRNEETYSEEDINDDEDWVPTDSSEDDSVNKRESTPENVSAHDQEVYHAIMEMVLDSIEKKTTNPDYDFETELVKYVCTKMDE